MTREELMNMSKKDLKNRLAELGKKAQALSGQELTDAMDCLLYTSDAADD